jgi:hypothetical protein
MTLRGTPDKIAQGVIRCRRTDVLPRRDILGIDTTSHSGWRAAVVSIKSATKRRRSHGTEEAWFPILVDPGPWATRRGLIARVGLLALRARPSGSSRIRRPLSELSHKNRYDYRQELAKYDPAVVRCLARPIGG